MLFNLEKEGFLRKLILAAFVLAMLGPWSFDLVNIPAQFPCEGLPVRLAGDFCGFPVSGFGGIIMVSTCLFRLPGVLATGNIAMLFPELTAVFIMLFVFLPVFSLLPLLRKKGSHRLQIMNLILWVLGGFGDACHAGNETAGSACHISGMGDLALYPCCDGCGHA